MSRLPERLRPEGFGGFGVEPFERWSVHGAAALPNVPLDLLESWLYRHWDQAQDDLVWLPIKRMRFVERGLSDAEVLALRFREDEDDDWLAYWGDEFLVPGTTHDRVPLGRATWE